MWQASWEAAASKAQGALVFVSQKWIKGSEHCKDETKFIAQMEMQWPDKKRIVYVGVDQTEGVSRLQSFFVLILVCCVQTHASTSKR